MTVRLFVITRAVNNIQDSFASLGAGAASACAGIFLYNTTKIPVRWCLLIIQYHDTGIIYYVEIKMSKIMLL